MKEEKKEEMNLESQQEDLGSTNSKLFERKSFREYLAKFTSNNEVPD